MEQQPNEANPLSSLESHETRNHFLNINFLRRICSAVAINLEPANYDAALLQAGISPDDIQIYPYDPQTGELGIAHLVEIDGPGYFPNRILRLVFQQVYTEAEVCQVDDQLPDGIEASTERYRLAGELPQFIVRFSGLMVPSNYAHKPLAIYESELSVYPLGRAVLWLQDFTGSWQPKSLPLQS